MSGPGPPEPGAGPTVEGYLCEVATRLPGPVRARTGIVAELRSGLLDATDAHRSAGLPPAEAALAAIREFGDPVQVAAGFRAEIAASQARRIAVTLLVTGPLVGLLWIATAAASHLGVHLAPPWPWKGQSPGLSVSIYLVAAAAGVTAWAALLGIAITGRAHPLAARQATPGSYGRGRRRIRRGERRRARPGAARGPVGRRPGTALPGPGRRGGRGQPHPGDARQARRTPVPGHSRQPDLTGPALRLPGRGRSM